MTQQPLQLCLERFMRSWVKARHEQAYAAHSPITSPLDELRLLLQEHLAQQAREHLQIEWSVGRGHWAHVPWLALMDERETTHARAGLYVTYLFCEDMSAVYVALVHGTLALVKEQGTARAHELLAKRRQALRRQLPWLARAGFAMTDDMDLRSRGKLARDYEHGVIAYKRYALEALPEDVQLLADLDELLDAYEQHLDGERGAPASAWLVRVDLDPQAWSEPLRLRQRARARSPQLGDQVLLWREPEGVLGAARVCSVKAGDKRHELSLELDQLQVWPEPMPQQAWRQALAQHPEPAPEAPTARQPLSALAPPLWGAVMAWHQEHLARFDRARELGLLIQALEAQGWRFEPWQITAYVVALRTRPLVILAGISGTGKSRLPALVAELTGAALERVAVRPDWSDSAELLGFVDLGGKLRPGALLRAAQRAMSEPEQPHVFLLDEMNLARVEQYMAEALSVMEDRRPLPEGGWRTGALMPQASATDAQGRLWSGVYLPPNLALVGTVNMDETTFGFSRKVLDRAFTLEMSEVDLAGWLTARVASTPGQGAARRRRWPASAWLPRALRVAELGALEPAEQAELERVARAIERANAALMGAQLQVGYRVCDEIALFVLHAREVQAHLRRAQGLPVDALDLAMAMKVLPRIVGGSSAARRALLGLLAWALDHPHEALEEPQARAHLERWRQQGRPWALQDAAFGHCAARLLAMWERLVDEGYTSYWR